MLASIISGCIGAGITLIGGLYWVRWYARVARESRERMGALIQEHETRWRAAIAELEGLRYPDSLVPQVKMLDSEAQETSRPAPIA